MSRSAPVSVTRAMDEAPLSWFHVKTMIISGMGFFTDAYDLFIVGAASALIASEWHLDSTEVGLINSMTLLGAFAGAILFGRLADRLGRRKLYGVEAAMMVVFAVASALASNVAWLIAFRLLLGIGIGGDYPVSAVLVSEYSNRRNRGRMIGAVFALQAAGTVAGYAFGLLLLSTGMGDGLVWRLMLGAGAIPAALVLYSRRHMPESPRYLARVAGDRTRAAENLTSFSHHPSPVTTPADAAASGRLTLRQFLGNRRHLLTLIGTAGTWFVFDYAYYGNSVSAPLIVKSVLGDHATLAQSLLLNLIIFSVAAVPGYILAVMFMDRIGHRRLQLIGFPMMAVGFLLIAVIPGVTTAVLPFLLLFGLSYFFAQFGPNTTTFVLAAECFPTAARTTGHGISAGVAKLGAFIGVYLFPVITHALGLHGALIFSAAMALAGMLLTFLIPETSGRSLEEISGEDSVEPAALVTVSQAA